MFQKENVKKRNCFTLKNKFDIIQRLQNGEKQHKICTEMKLSKSTVASLWKKRDQILKNFESFNSNIKKVKYSTNPEVDKNLLKWFSQKRSENVPISGAILQSKGESLKTILEPTSTNSTLSRSWIERFKKRHAITSGKIVGESNSVDENIVSDWIQNKWPLLRQNFRDEDIFNCDETGLFYKLTPDRTLKFKGESCKGGKLSKERITVLVTANLTGSEKRQLMIIGKYKNPRCFKNIHRLPVNYKFNKRAWMTSEIFTTELREWDQELLRKKRKILLLVDNCPAHPKVEGLRHIKLVFMPPNTSSKLQPMDQGIIHSLKSYYRKILLSRIIDAMDSEDQFSVNLLDAINFINMAWQNVTKQTIRNCFRHGGFIENKENFDSEDELPLSEWIQKNTSAVEALPNGWLQDKFDEYVNVDQNLSTQEDADYLIEQIQIDFNESDEVEDETDIEQEAVQNNVPTLAAARRGLEKARLFLQSQPTTPIDILNSLARTETFIENISSKKHKQTKIFDFFN